MKIVAMTGATGFVGRSLAHYLAEQGAAIRALVRPRSDRTCLGGVPVAWVEGDILQPDTLAGFCDGADALVHAAGMLGRAGVPEHVYQRLHVRGTQHVLAEALTAGDAGRFSGPVLHVSSPGVLGPIDGPAADETAVPAPSNAYERSKAAGEAVAVGFVAKRLPVVVARPEFIYGPGDHHVYGLFRAIARGHFFYVGDGLATCHPTYIDDAVRGLQLALERGRAGAIYHITGPKAVTFRNLGQTIAAALGVRPPWLRLPRTVAWLVAAGLEGVARLMGQEPLLSRTGVDFFSQSRSFSWQKARRELNYVPQLGLADGVARTVAWYRERGWL